MADDGPSEIHRKLRQGVDSEPPVGNGHDVRRKLHKIVRVLALCLPVSQGCAAPSRADGYSEQRIELHPDQSEISKVILELHELGLHNHSWSVLMHAISVRSVHVDATHIHPLGSPSVSASVRDVLTQRTHVRAHGQGAERPGYLLPQ